MILIGIFAFAGGIIGALLGWLESNEPFNARKFCGSLLRAFIAGFSFSLVYEFTKPAPEVRDFIIALLAGAGVDAVAKRSLGAIRVQNER